MSDLPSPDPAPPGAPSGGAGTPSGAPEGVQDEFAHVPDPPRKRAWRPALVVALAGYLLFHQRADFTYALTSSTPHNLGEAAALFAKSDTGAAPALPLNRTVRINGKPDFESGVLLDTQGDWKFRQMYRLQGTSGRLFIKRLPDPLPVGLAERGSYAGRLVSLADLSFAGSIRAYFERTLTATHFFPPDGLLQALAGGGVPLTVTDRAGNRVTLEQNELLTFTVARPGRYRVFIPKGDMYFTDLAAARAALLRTGANVLTPGEPARPAPERGDGFSFAVGIDDAVAPATLSAIADIAPPVRVGPWLDEIVTAVKHVKAGTGGFVVAQEGADAVTLDAATVRSVRTVAPVRVPADAVLLIEGERPSQHYKSIVAAAFLLVFAAINLMALSKRAWTS